MKSDEMGNIILNMDKMAQKEANRLYELCKDINKDMDIKGIVTVYAQMLQEKLTWRNFVQYKIETGEEDDN